MFRTLSVALLLAAPAALADEPVTLKPGPGLDAVQASCATCHTLNYIRMNSVFLTPDVWKAEVTRCVPLSAHRSTTTRRTSSSSTCRRPMRRRRSRDAQSTIVQVRHALAGSVSRGRCESADHPKLPAQRP